MIKNLIKFTTIIVVAVYVFHPERHAKHYPYIQKYDTLSELVVSPNYKYSNLKQCVYKNMLLNSYDIRIEDIRKNHFNSPDIGGEYFPKTCQPLYKTAIIVPYRKREEQLEIFLYYMHSFLQNQNLHYKIFIVEQRDSMPFNRAKMFNIGAREAMRATFPCLILHDVDLIPLVSANMYACTQKPRHMSSCIDTFRYQIPYVELFGGVVAIQAKQFTRVNGMSNEYIGWGGEDDDFYRRLKAYNYTICRFAPAISRYTMLRHKKAIPSANRYELLKTVLDRQNVDGLNSLPNEYRVIEKPLYTHIVVT